MRLAVLQVRVLRKVGAVGHDDGDDDAEDAQRAAKNLDDEDFDEEGRVLRVGERARRAGHADANPEGGGGEAKRNKERRARG